MLYLPASVPTASRASHHANMGSVALLSPFRSPEPIKYPGLALGKYSGTSETFYVDIHLWKRLGLLEAPIVFADGEIGSGKTSLAIVAALAASLLAVEEDRKFKIMYEITRRNVGVAELSSLTRELDATVEDMSTYGINIFAQDFGLTAGELLDIVLECFNYIEKRDATTLEVIILMAALRIFLKNCKEDERYRDEANNLHYEKCLATLTVDQAKAAIVDTSEWELETTNKQDGASSTGEGEELDNYLEDSVLSAKDVNIDEAEFIAARDSCLRTIVRLRKGEYGRVFNGKNSIAKLFDRQALGVDLTNLNEATVGLLQTLFWKFKRSAANSADAERRRRFVFDWEIHDENRESWLQAPYRREVPRYLKRIRAVNCVMWFNLHRIPGDYETLPEPARSAALNAVREGTIFFHGKHDSVGARQTCDYFGYTQTVFQAMRYSRKGEFVFRAGPLPPQKIVIVLSASQMASTFSEEASQTKTRVSTTLSALSERV